MTMLLRAVLIVVSVATTWMILRKIRTSKMRIEDSIFWIGFFLMLILFSLFPQIVYWMTELAGVQTPVNFIFLFIIFVFDPAAVSDDGEAVPAGNTGAGAYDAYRDRREAGAGRRSEGELWKYAVSGRGPAARQRPFSCFF